MTRGRDGSLRQVDDAADLTALLESLGTDVVELAAAPHGLGVAVGEPVIYDASERSAIAPRRGRSHPDRPDRDRGRRRRGGADVSTVGHELSDMWVLTVRNSKRIPRQPDLLIGFTVQPVMFVLLFVYALGGAISTPGYSSYVDYLIPGIAVQTIAFGGFVTALGLSEDLKKGLFPLTFVSSAFVQVESMPGWLQPVAEHNPFTAMVNAVRGLFLGTPAGDEVWVATAWTIGITLVFAALAIWRYRRVVAR